MRQRALELLEQNNSKKIVSQILGVSRSTLRRWQQRSAEGQLAPSYPKQRGGFRVDDQKLKLYVANNPDAYQAEIASAIGAKENTVCRALKRLKISRKKRRHSIENAILKNERRTNHR